VGLTTLPCKKKIVEKSPKNSAGFCGGDQGLSWAVEPRKEERRRRRRRLRLGHNCSAVVVQVVVAVIKVKGQVVPVLK
jgi:hypothetical protein